MKIKVQSVAETLGCTPADIRDIREKLLQYPTRRIVHGFTRRQWRSMVRAMEKVVSG